MERVTLSGKGGEEGANANQEEGKLVLGVFRESGGGGGRKGSQNRGKKSARTGGQEKL